MYLSDAAEDPISSDLPQFCFLGFDGAVSKFKLNLLILIQITQSSRDRPRADK